MIPIKMCEKYFVQTKNYSNKRYIPILEKGFTFMSVSQIVSSKLPIIENNMLKSSRIRKKETMFLCPTDESEVSKILENMKNKKKNY